MKARPVKTYPPCKRCHCVAVLIAEYGDEWEPPREDCECDCHAAWRMVNGTPGNPVPVSLAAAS